MIDFISKVLFNSQQKTQFSVCQSIPQRRSSSCNLEKSARGTRNFYNLKICGRQLKSDWSVSPVGHFIFWLSSSFNEPTATSPLSFCLSLLSVTSSAIISEKFNSVNELNTKTLKYTLMKPFTSSSLSSLTVICVTCWPRQTRTRLISLDRQCVSECLPSVAI